MATALRTVAWEEFRRLLLELGMRIDSDPDQEAAVEAPVGQSLQLVAGPGTGKTTALTLRTLKLVFVEGVPPSAIVATTFTKKAAEELHSRIVGWGDDVRKALVRRGLLPPDIVQRIDLNQITTGTLDSISEQVMADTRIASVDTIVPAENFVASAYMRSAGLFPDRRFQDVRLRNYIGALMGSTWGLNINSITRIAREVRDRLLHDQIDSAGFLAARNSYDLGVDVLLAAIQDYVAALEAQMLTDFAGIEGEFLFRLRGQHLATFLSSLKVVLVDEYQDTNLLQHLVYIELARAAVANNGSIVVVGDDDQSLYRFRGATVDLFTTFSQRLASELGVEARTIYLHRNYRSTKAIVDWGQAFVTLDVKYQPVRAVDKPALRHSRGNSVEYPVLGMFRETVQNLAEDLAAVLDAVINGPGFRVPNTKPPLVICLAQHGAPGDCALLCSSPQDYTSGGSPRLPLLLRQALAGLVPSIEVFNPRGERFADARVVARLCGLMLECCDPEAAVEGAIHNLFPDTRSTFQSWRRAANEFVRSCPPDPTGRRDTLGRFVDHWQRRVSQRAGGWPAQVPVVELLYKLISWMPDVQDDAEALLYLEAITRTMSAAQAISRYECNIVRDGRGASASVRELLWNVFVPISAGDAEIDEELMQSFPRDRVGVLSIHQAKGLQFPLTMVDVSSDFRADHPSQRFKRFPTTGALPQRLEDELWSYSSGLTAPTRSAVDRAFDDLIRQYFVAFTRAQDVLVLVGLGHEPDSGPSEPRDIPNVALGFDRERTWHWRNNPRLMLI